MTSATRWIRTTSTGPTGKESSAITAAVILVTASSPRSRWPGQAPWHEEIPARSGRGVCQIGQSS